MKLASETFGRRLRAIRRDRGFTQAELGALVGRSKQLISAWECGNHEIRLGDAERIAVALHCRLEDLLAPLDKRLPRRPSSWFRVQQRLQQQMKPA